MIFCIDALNVAATIEFKIPVRMSVQDDQQHLLRMIETEESKVDRNVQL